MVPPERVRDGKTLRVDGRGEKERWTERMEDRDGEVWLQRRRKKKKKG